MSGFGNGDLFSAIGACAGDSVTVEFLYDSLGRIHSFIPRNEACSQGIELVENDTGFRMAAVQLWVGDETCFITNLYCIPSKEYAGQILRKTFDDFNARIRY